MTQPLNHTSPEDVPQEVVKVRKKSVLREYTEAILVAVLLALLIRTFVVQAFKIPSGSMIPTLLVGDHILVNKFVYRFHPIDRGDVVVFWYPKDPSVSFIKRVIGMPDDTVELRNGVLYVNGSRLPETYVRPNFRDDESYPPVVVKKGYYYVLGDHRNSSNDSRNWGEVPERYIYGKAFFRFWPLSKIGFIH